MTGQHEPLANQTHILLYPPHEGPTFRLNCLVYHPFPYYSF